MKHLPNVTMVCVDTKNYAGAIGAIRKSLLQITPAKTLFFTNLRASAPNFPFDIVKIDDITSKEEYSRFIVKELWKHITTDYVLVVQHDGYCINGDAWEEEFLKYDYIGASWLESDGYNVGNGGFSIRSKKLMVILGTDNNIKITHPEDSSICRLYRPYLEYTYGITYAPDTLADRFSFELREPICPTFGFHGAFHKPFQPVVVVKRTGAVGDVVAMEPLLHFLHEQGNKVVIDVPLHIALMYKEHYFKVFHISQLDERIPRTVIDLDMTYENNPKELHLTSYFKAAGIPYYKPRNPKMQWDMNDDVRMFKKYVVFHISDRDQPHRNVQGLDWETLVSLFLTEGYNVFQVGVTGGYEIPNAIQINTVGINMLMYVIAGASYFVGVDSGPAAIAVAYNIPAVIFSGSVDLRLIHPDMSNILWIHNHDKAVCKTPFCWHNLVSTTGQDCTEDIAHPPCVQFDTKEVVTQIEYFLNKSENEHQHTSTGEGII